MVQREYPQWRVLLLLSSKKRELKVHRCNNEERLKCVI